VAAREQLESWRRTQHTGAAAVLLNSSRACENTVPYSFARRERIWPVVTRHIGAGWINDIIVHGESHDAAAEWSDPALNDDRRVGAKLLVANVHVCCSYSLIFSFWSPFSLRLVTSGTVKRP
jgi:hypothetical protein